jgi:hypothetical protein
MSSIAPRCIALLLTACAGIAAAAESPTLNPVRFAAAPEGPAVQLVRDAAPCATIVLADAALKSRSGPEFQAATDLAKYVKLATGAELPMASDATVPAGTLIAVGGSRVTRDAGISGQDLPAEGFRVQTFARGLAIVGWQPPAAGDPGQMGTLWGVYDVLERYLGIRFYHPGADGFIVPPAKQLTIPPVHYTDHPVRIKRTGWPPPAPPEYRAGESTAVGHACHTPGNFGIHFQEFPECFELGVDGKRHAGMPCYGSPRTVELMLRDLENFFKGDKRPYGWGEPTQKVYYISPPDKTVECRCEHCRPLLDEAAAGLGRASGLVARFVAAMATEIGKRHPGMTVHYLPYSNYTLPPAGITLPPNVVVTVCLMRGAANEKEPLVAADHDRMIAGWAGLTGKPVRVWHYPCWPVEDTALPFQYPHTIQAFMRRHLRDVEGAYLDSGYHPPELGPEGIWMSQAPTFYCWYRLMWNPEFDVDAALREYVELMYGPAREPMGRILTSLIDRWERTRWQSPPDGHHISPRQVHEETMPRAEALKLRDWLAQARQLAPADTVARRRVDYFGRSLELFLRESDAYHEGGKDLPSLAVLKTSGLPTVDGRLDDPCWRDAAAQPFTMALTGTAPDAGTGTTVQAVWTDEGVVFGFKLLEPAIAAIRATRTQHDQDVFWDDCIELFLDVDGRREKYCQIVTNSRGVLYDGTANGGDWNAAGARAAAHKDRDFWSLEVFVPYADFPGTPHVKVGTVWYANFCRSRFAGGGHELQRWSTLKRPSNLDFSAFGKLRFVE